MRPRPGSSTGTIVSSANTRAEPNTISASIWQSGVTAAEAYCDLRGLAVAWSGSGFGALTVSRKCSDSRRARHVGKPISYPSLGSYERAALRPKFLPDMTDINP